MENANTATNENTHTTKKAWAAILLKATVIRHGRRYLCTTTLCTLLDRQGLRMRLPAGFDGWI